MDVSDEDFPVKLEHVIASWESSPMPSSSNLAGFVNWFRNNKSHAIRDSMLKSLRVECGLGCPPEQFTTNASESINPFRACAIILWSLSTPRHFQQKVNMAMYLFLSSDIFFTLGEQDSKRSKKMELVVLLQFMATENGILIVLKVSVSDYCD